MKQASFWSSAAFANSYRMSDFTCCLKDSCKQKCSTVLSSLPIFQESDFRSSISECEVSVESATAQICLTYTKLWLCRRLA